MLIVTLIAGIVTGFVVSVPPLGPIAFALISKGFSGEVKKGMAVASGSAFMDMIYALIAFGGISLFISLLPTAAENFINGNARVLQIILIYTGCAVVILYGFKIMRNKVNISQLKENENKAIHSAEERAERFVQKSHVHVSKESNLFGSFITGVMLCLSSITLPASWFALVGYVKGFGVIESSFWGGLVYSAGAFTGTVLWFWLLLKLIAGNKHKINPSTIGKLNFIAGIVLITLGVFLFVKATATVFNWF
jgi:threonine/homoserine/homoserine lactone efflux protein